MLKCLQYAVDGIRSSMPEGSDLEEWFDMAPAWTEPLPRLPSELRYWVGYLNGVADGLDMTVRSVLDEYNIDTSNEVGED